MFLENSGKTGILNSKLFAWLALVLSTILVSSFYAFARLKFQFNGFSPDFMICVVTMNVIVASISFVAVEAYARYGLSKAKRVA
jgi:ABC-type glycerol-3-phosphate transport system permease component